MKEAVPEEFSDGLVAIGDQGAMAERIVSFARSRDELRRRGARLRDTSQSRYQLVEAVAERWARFLGRVWAATVVQECKRGGVAWRLAYAVSKRIGGTG